MTIMEGIISWFMNPSNWVGNDGILARTLEHIYYVTISIILATIVALPIGFLLANNRLGSQIAIGVFNIGRALPSLGVVILAIMIIGYDPSTVIFALVIMSIPLLLTNTIVGINQIDSSLKQSAKAMGLRRWQIVTQLELPLAFTLIFAAFRTATIQLIATATIAAYAGFGGLGRFLIDGLGRNDTPQVIGGAILVSALAIVIEWGCSKAEKILTQRIRPGLSNALHT